MADSTSTTTLLSLPNELLAAIAIDLETADLLALRLTRREVSTATDVVFVEQSFKRRTHLYTKHALQALVNISAIPRLANRLCEIRIVAVEVELLPVQAIKRYSSSRQIEQQTQAHEQKWQAWHTWHMEEMALRPRTESTQGCGLVRNNGSLSELRAQDLDVLLLSEALQILA